MKVSVLGALNAVLHGSPTFRLSTLYLLTLLASSSAAYYFQVQRPEAISGIVTVFIVLAITLAATVPLLLKALKADVREEVHDAATTEPRTTPERPSNARQRAASRTARGQHE